MLRPFRPRCRPAWLAVALLLALAFPVTAAAHAELTTSTPADDATVPSPFDGPVVLSFSEPLADGSKAELAGPDGTTVAAPVVDGPGATMTIPLGVALDPGAYDVQWTAATGDGHVERGTISFTVAPPVSTPTLPPTAEPTAAATPEPILSPATPTATAESSASPSPKPEPTDAPSPVLPIVIALIVLGGGAAYLLRQRRSTSPR